MENWMMLAFGLARHPFVLKGSNGLDDLSDELLRDIGYRRVGGRVMKDEFVAEEGIFHSRGWDWPEFAKMREHDSNPATA